MVECYHYFVTVFSQTRIISSINATITCENEISEYRCMDAVNIAWNVEGFINNVSFFNFVDDLGRIVSSIDRRISIIQLSVNPIVTLMSIPGSITENLALTCTGSSVAMASYQSGGKYMYSCNRKSPNFNGL